MLTVFLIVLLAVYFSFVSWKAGACRPEERSRKITKPLAVFINLSPLAGMVIFAVLFAFVLKGRFTERWTHALLVFALWMYATRFYQYILSHYKKKKILMASAVGMIFSVALAVLLTPLDRYVERLYASLGWCAAFPGIGLYILFYAMAFLDVKKAGKSQ